MKIQKLFVTVAALSTLLIFAGCSTKEATPKTSTTPASNTQTNASLAITDGTSTQVPVIPAAEQKILSAADQAAYSGAMRLNDSSFCDKISDADYAKQCKTALSDQTAMQEALDKKDVSLCKNLSSADQQKSCEIKLEVIQQEQAKEASILEEQKLGDQIVRAGDFKACQTLTVFGHKLDCESNILSPLAIEKKDKSICSQATMTEARQNCESKYDFSSQVITK